MLYLIYNIYLYTVKQKQNNDILNHIKIKRINNMRELENLFFNVYTHTNYIHILCKKSASQF